MNKILQLENSVRCQSSMMLYIYVAPVKSKISVHIRIEEIQIA